MNGFVLLTNARIRVMIFKAVQAGFPIGVGNDGIKK